MNDNNVKFLATLDIDTKTHMAENVYCPYELYQAIRKDADPKVRAGAARNVVLATPFIDEFLCDESEVVKDACISTQRLIEKQVWSVLRDPSATWRNIGTLAKHHKFTRKQVKYLFKDMVDTVEQGDYIYGEDMLGAIFANEGVNESDVLNYLKEDNSYGATTHAIMSGKLSKEVLEDIYFSASTHKDIIVGITDSELIIADAKALFEKNGTYGEELLSNPYVDAEWKEMATVEIGTVFAYKVAKGGA